MMDSHEPAFLLELHAQIAAAGSLYYSKSGIACPLSFEKISKDCQHLFFVRLSRIFLLQTRTCGVADALLPFINQADYAKLPR